MARQTNENPSEHGNPSDRGTAPFSVIAEVTDVQSARLLVEDLEGHGIPTTAILLHGFRTESSGESGGHDPESRVFADVSKSAILGGAGGAAVGVLLGIAMVAFAIPELGWVWGAVLGGLFGSAIGGAAGGVSVVKYSSPAWQDSLQATEADGPSVEVSHREESVIDSATEVISRHEAIVTSVARFEDGSPAGS